MYYMYCSERNNELIARRARLITCENYLKWYDLYYTTNAGTACRLGDLLEDVYDIDYYDHAWKPVSVLEFAKKHGLKVGLVSYIAIVLRWNYSRSVNDSNQWKNKQDLPTYKLFDEIVKDDYGHINGCDFIYLDAGGEPIPYMAYKGDIKRELTQEMQDCCKLKKDDFKMED